MKAADLYIMLQEGEGVMLEYKEALSSSLARELVVLANTAGGRILLGVRDDGTVKRMRNKAHVQHCPEPIFEENGFFTTLFYPNPEVRVMAGTQDAPRTAQVGTKIRPMRHGNPQYKYRSSTAQVPLKYRSSRDEVKFLDKCSSDSAIGELMARYPGEPPGPSSGTKS